jgi:hypothetical protein
VPFHPLKLVAGAAFLGFIADCSLATLQYGDSVSVLSSRLEGSQ